MNKREMFKSGKGHVIKTLQLLGYKVIDMHEDNAKCPYHLLVNKKIKLRIITSNPFLTKKSGWCYYFNSTELQSNCHFVILVGFNGNDKDIYVVPRKKIKQNMQTIKIPTDSFAESQYSLYKNRWGLIESNLFKTA